MRSRARGFHARVKGFTLVEVAISVAIVAALTGAVALVVTNNASDAAGNTSAAKGGVVQMQDGLGTVRDGLAGPRPVAPFAISYFYIKTDEEVRFVVAGATTGGMAVASSFLAALEIEGVIESSGVGNQHRTSYSLPVAYYDANGTLLAMRSPSFQEPWQEGWFAVLMDDAGCIQGLYNGCGYYGWVTGEILIPGYQPIPFTRN